MCPLLEEGLGSGHEGNSIEPLNDRTIDGEVTGRERCPTGRCKQAILDESQNLELLTQLTTVSFVNCILGPGELFLRAPGADGES